MLYGRDVEQARIDALLDGARASLSSVLVIRGEAGIGKSSLLDHAVASTEDIPVLRATGIESESERFEGDPRRGVVPITFLAGYALLFGFTLTLIAGAFGVGADAPFLDRVLAMSLISAGVAASTAALVAFIGPAGSAVASVLYFILGAQISGAGTAREFLPTFWGDLGHYLPGGAGTSLLRDVFYFPEASAGQPLAVLGAYAGAGLLVLIALYLVHVRRRVPAPVPTAA
jgi:AAA ATPase domain